MESTNFFSASLPPLTETIDAVPDTAWDNPSPCEGWTARDVVGHLIDTQRDFLTRHGIDLGAAPTVATDPARAWRDHLAVVTDRLADPGVRAATFDSYFGPTTVGATLDTFYGFDLVVHRWDIARATGLQTTLTDDEIDRIDTAADGFGAALYSDGVCKPGPAPAAEADRTTRLLARLGRVA